MRITKTLAAVLGLSFLGALAVAPLQAQEHEFIGTKNCKKCHIKEWRSWDKTKMSKAYDILLPGERAEAKTEHGLDPDKDYTKDEKCLRCHTTGYGKPGGFVSLEKTPELVGIGCEVCHGAGGTYTREDLMSNENKEYARADVVAAGMIHPIGAEVCESCHNSDNPTAPDEPFDFAKRKEDGTHEIYPLKYDH